jgi:hypothetical protein
VIEELPANRSPTGFGVPSFEKSTEPESPPALIGPVTIWFVKETLKCCPPLHFRAYWIVTDVLIEVIVPVVKPVVRPLFITGRPRVAACTDEHGTPMSRIAPVASTFARAVESAASTFADPRGT